MTYSDSWKYLYAAQKSLEHRKADKHIVKIVDSGLYFIFLFSLYFTFTFFFLFNFLFLEQLGLGFISHAVTSVTN